MMVKLTGLKEQSIKFRRKYNHNTFKIRSNSIIVYFINICTVLGMAIFHMLNLVNIYAYK